MHTRHTAHAVGALAETNERRQKRAAVPAFSTKSSSGCAGVPALGILPPHPRTVSVRLHCSPGSIRHFNAETQPLETVHHRLRVLAPEGTVQDYGVAR